MMLGDSFKNGVEYYTRCRATVIINFPEDKVCCAYCQFLKQKYGLPVYECRLTGEPILRPEKGIGNICPADEIE